MGQLSDPYNQGEEEQDLTISGLPDESLSAPGEAASPPPTAPSKPRRPDEGSPTASTEDDDQDDVDIDDEDVEDGDDEDEDDESDEDAGGDGDLDEEVAYNLDEFEDDQLDALFDALDEENIAYLWDGDELFVRAADEQHVDELLERVANPDALAAEDDDGDGGGWMLGELFVVADRLQHDPEEHESVALLLQLANACDEADVPYGLAEPEWQQLRERVTALATILEQDKPDPDAAIESARELRGAIRPYV